MHATWAFLVETHELEDVDVTNFEEFWADFYDDAYSDGDNWFLPMTIIHDTGELIPICAEGAYRGTDWMWQRLQNMDETERFDWGLNFVASTIAGDFDVMVRSINDVDTDDFYEDVSREELFQRIGNQIESKLEAILTLQRGLAPARPDVKENRKAAHQWDRLYDSWQIENFLSIYQQWVHAQQHDNKFSMFGGRDNVRCGYRGMQLNDSGYFPEGHEHARPVSLVILDYHY